MGAGLGVLILGLIIFLPVCDWIGGKGALFNPAHNAAFAAMRQGSTQSHVIRIVGHVFSSLTASTGVLVVLPLSLLPGVQLDIAIHCTSLTIPLQHILCIWSHVKLMSTPDYTQQCWYVTQATDIAYNCHFFCRPFRLEVLC